MAAGKTFESKLGKQYYLVVLEHQDTPALLNSYMIQKYNQPAIDEKNEEILPQQRTVGRILPDVQKAHRQPRDAGHQILCPFGKEQHV